MENKKNYVDGIDVSACEHYRAEIETKMPYGEYEIQKDKCHYSGIEIIQDCKGIKDCIYKQLKRLERQYEDVLKLAKENADSNEYCLQELEQENERLKEENYQLQKDCQICENFIDFIPCKPIRDMDYDLQNVISQRDNYYQALQEIRDIVSEPCIVDENCQTCNSGCMQKDILDKINEVIGAEE